LGVEGWALQGEVCGCLVIAAAAKYTLWAGLVFLGGSVGHWGEPGYVEHLEPGAPVHCSVQVVGESVGEFLDLWAQDGQMLAYLVNIVRSAQEGALYMADDDDV
jgi:hypothetical protein